MPPRTPGSDFYLFTEILAEARRKGKSFNTARLVYEKRVGERCPFVEHPPLARVAVVEFQLCTIDFETRSRCSLTDCGSAVYAAHPSTEVLCMSYKFDNEVTRLWTPEDGGLPNAISAHIALGGIIEAHNAAFEQDIWEYVCVARMHWPSVPAKQWRDSMAQCAAMAIPISLGGAAMALRLAQQKDDAGRATMLKLSQPRRPTKKDPSEWNNDPGLFEHLYRYCRQDVDTEYAVSKATPALSADELDVWHASNAINRRGIYCDTAAVRAAITTMEKAKAFHYARVHEATGGVINGDNLGSWQSVLPWCMGQGVIIPNYQKGTLTAALQGELPPQVRAVFAARLATGRTATAKFQAMLDRQSSDQRIRNCFVYHGATPGRWTGRGIQTQNLPRGTWKPQVIEDCIRDMAVLDFDTFRDFYGEPMLAVSNCIRGMLTAAPGKVLVAADYASIEARVLLWMAGDPGVSIFRENRDIYKEMASAIFNVLVDQVDAYQRFVGKEAVLGLGYGMGAEKFVATCAQKGVTITLEFAQQVVATYRERFVRVKQLWADVEAAALGALRSGKVTVAACLKFKMDGPHLKCRLPSGRIITYPFAQIGPVKTPWGETRDAMTFMTEVGEARTWMRSSTYGGSLVENADQAISRDLEALAIVRYEKASLPVVLHTHDEVVCELPESHPMTGEEFATLMCELPGWGKGLPIKAEGWRAIRYKKG